MGVTVNIGQRYGGHCKGGEESCVQKMYVCVAELMGTAAVICQTAVIKSIL